MPLRQGAIQHTADANHRPRRNATRHFYYALKTLDYRSYHQLEVFRNDVPYMRIVNDVITDAWRRPAAKIFQPLGAFLASSEVGLVGIVDAYTQHLIEVNGNFCYILQGGRLPWTGPAEGVQAAAGRVYTPGELQMMVIGGHDSVLEEDRPQGRAGRGRPYPASVWLCRRKWDAAEAMGWIA
ncbi:hypothetical protein LZ31DRAFT_599005 [Colletotrichum somersetense]|nr:hypothetical protein LZ31DRAFT_599005 [Colletotrichum somersetense]